ncbi:hypothetical protein M5D96_003129 [Drosophila gunungcola]|uniref:Uncharacterized protein n=1 Tax=Drosophila gunungcola TaxID=103775 RepID=A0A9Q0BWQ5_9MUSC|nr:hypothetical protein M5D96_003129 [Drosophila gunungcola]
MEEQDAQLVRLHCWQYTFFGNRCSGQSLKGSVKKWLPTRIPLLVRVCVSMVVFWKTCAFKTRL